MECWYKNFASWRQTNLQFYSTWQKCCLNTFGIYHQTSLFYTAKSFATNFIFLGKKRERSSFAFHKGIKPALTNVNHVIIEGVSLSVKQCPIPIFLNEKLQSQSFLGQADSYST
ncbi:UNVERIFIED_CONTAM: hypothetical protein K2H54_048468 [Gekko kuhli]